MNDLIVSSRVAGELLFHGVDIYHKDTDVIELRRRVRHGVSEAESFPEFCV